MPALVVSASACYLVPYLGNDSTGSVADLHHPVLDMGREPGRPDNGANVVFTFQPQALIRPGPALQRLPQS